MGSGRSWCRFAPLQHRVEFIAELCQLHKNKFFEFRRLRSDFCLSKIGVKTKQKPDRLGLFFICATVSVAVAGTHALKQSFEVSNQKVCLRLVLCGWFHCFLSFAFGLSFGLCFWFTGDFCCIRLCCIGFGRFGDFGCGRGVELGVGLLSWPKHPFLGLLRHRVLRPKCVYEPAKIK